MVFRNYRIEIHPRNGNILPSVIPTVFGCTVSSPSALVVKGSTDERGLVFTDINGSTFNNHPVFTHLAFFTKQFPGNPPEIAEITAVVDLQLTGTNIKSNQINIRVSFLDTYSI